MAERGAKLKFLLKEHSIVEQLIVESGGEVPLSKEDVFYPAMPEAGSMSAMNEENIDGLPQTEPTNPNERRLQHERKIK